MKNIRVTIKRSDGYFKEFLEIIQCSDKDNWMNFSTSLSKIQKDVNIELSKLISENIVSVIEEESEEELTDDDDYKRKFNEGDLKESKKTKSK